MLRHVALVTTDVSEELSASFIRVTRIGDLGTALAVTSNRRKLLVFFRRVRRLPVTASVVPSSPILVTLTKDALRSSETLVLTRATRRKIPENAILNLSVLFATCFRLVSCLDYSSNMKTEATCSSKYRLTFKWLHRGRALDSH
jgi:hypothetical protein